MSAPVTPAVERAGDAFTEAYQRAVREAPSNRQGQGITREDGRKCYQAGIRAGLAAALDIEEMARAMCPHSHCDGTKRSCPDHSVNVERATALRTALLGADS